MKIGIYINGSVLKTDNLGNERTITNRKITTNGIAKEGLERWVGRRADGPADSRVDVSIKIVNELTDRSII